MAAKRRKNPDDVPDLLRTMLIVQLGLAGVSRQSIRVVAGCDMNRVTAVLKHVVPKGSTKKKKGVA
jgi:hypothetical protein